MPKKFLNLAAVFILIFSVLASGCGGSEKRAAPGPSVTVSVIESASKTSETPGETMLPVAEEKETESPGTETVPEETPEATVPEQTEAPSEEETSQILVTEDGWYSDKEHVALYIHLYGHLPDNYITKRDAEDAGWDSGRGNLWDVCPDMSIGGDRFGNYEGILPKAKGRQYYECDIDYEADYDPSTRNSRNAKRIVFSSDGLIYYTEDHYESFELLYGEP